MTQWRVSLFLDHHLSKLQSYFKKNNKEMLQREYLINYKG